MLHHTTFGTCTVAWQIAGRARRAEIRSLIDRSLTDPGCRMEMDGSIVAIPNAEPGTIFFGTGDQWPDLPQVGEWLPRYWQLWDAVQAQYWDVLLPVERRLPGGVMMPHCQTALAIEMTLDVTVAELERLHAGLRGGTI